MVVRLWVRQLDFADWVEGETRPRWVASGLKQPGALLVEPVDQDTTPKFFNVKLGRLKVAITGFLMTQGRGKRKGII